MKTYLLTILIIAKCGVDQQQTMTKNQTQMELSSCMNLLKNNSISFNTKIDFSACDLDSILSEAGIKVADSISTTLGTNQTPTTGWKINQENGVQITFWAQNNALVKIDIVRDFEAQEELVAFRENNGEPSVTLDYYFDVIKMKNKTAVYPEHGIALFYGMSENSVYSWSYFTPTTSELYKENLHPVNAPREFEEH